MATLREHCSAKSYLGGRGQTDGPDGRQWGPRPAFQCLGWDHTRGAATAQATWNLRGLPAQAREDGPVRPPPPGTAGLTAPPVPALVAARCGRDPRAGDPGEGARPPAECPGNQDAVPCPWGRAGAPQGLSTQGPARGGVRPLAWAPRRTRLLCPPPLRSAPRSAGPEPREPLTSGNPPLPRKCPSTRSVF